MTDTEFDIIDELYFVTAFRDLLQQLDLPEDALCHHLQKLVAQGYVKCFYPDPDTEVPYQEADFLLRCRTFYYLATKAGLVAHNSR